MMKNRAGRRNFLKQAVILAPALAFPLSSQAFKLYNMSKDMETFDVVITGGSYAGLSAAMALGRSLRKVLIIDSGKPCNRQTPHSHNFITHDGKTPKEISDQARTEVLKYDTVQLLNDLVTGAEKNGDRFTVHTASGKTFTSRKLLFTTGVQDEMPPIPGFAECWGISVLHCPYCHGYEVKNTPTGIIGNGDMGFEFCKMIHHWTKDLVLLTNGESTLSNEQVKKLESRGIRVVEKTISSLTRKEGYVERVVFADGSSEALSALYARPEFKQHSTVPEFLGCQLNEHGYIQVNEFQQTSVAGIYAAGDNTSMFRALSHAVAAGGKAGAVINKELIEEDF